MDGRSRKSHVARLKFWIRGASVAAGGMTRRCRGSAHGLRGGCDFAVLARGVGAGVLRTTLPLALACRSLGSPGLSGSRTGGVGRARHRCCGGPVGSLRHRHPGNPGLRSGLGGGVAGLAGGPAARNPVSDGVLVRGRSGPCQPGGRSPSRHPPGRRPAGCAAGRRQTLPPHSGPPPAGGRPAVRTPRRRAGDTCHGAPTGDPSRSPSQELSSMTSISSRESLSKARHMATSSQESRGPCSTPVASSTTV